MYALRRHVDLRGHHGVARVQRVLQLGALPKVCDLGLTRFRMKGLLLRVSRLGFRRGLGLVGFR